MTLLAVLSDVQLITLILVAVICVALFINIICLLVYFKKNGKNSSANQLQQNYYPVIIRETKRVPVEKQVVYVPVAAEPVAEEPEEEEIPTVEKEIAVAEAVAQMQAVVVDDSENAMRYNRSFRARLIQSEDEVKEWYGALKNCILSYDKVSSRISWKHENFTYRRNAVAKLFIKGKTLYLYLAVNPADYADSKYKLEDVSNVSQFADTPALYKLKSEKRVRYAQDLIEEICTKLGSKKLEREPVDYYEPYNSDAALIKKGLVKRVIEDASKSFIGASGYSKAQDADTESDKS